MDDGAITNPCITLAWQRTLIIATGLALLLPSVFRGGFHYPDEIRYAEVAREMVLLGDPVLPHLNGEPYSDKPPMFFWLSALLDRLGADAYAGRLVSAMASLITMLLIASIGTRMHSPYAGLAAAFVFITTEMPIWLSHRGVIDPLLATCTTVALYGLVRIAHRRRNGVILLGTGMALAVLTKGPVGVLFPAIAALSWQVIVPPERRLPVRSLLTGLTLAAAWIMLWVVPASLAGGPEYATDLLLHQNLGRAVRSFAHDKPWHYYLRSLPIALLPWLFVLPMSMKPLFKAGATARRERLAMLLTVITGIALFSLFSGKRTRYLLPLFPCVALVIGTFLADWSSRFLSTRATATRAFLNRCTIGAAIGAILVIVVFDRVFLPRIDHERSSYHAVEDFRERFLSDGKTVECAFLRHNMAGAFNYHLGIISIPLFEDPEIFAAYLDARPGRIGILFRKDYERIAATSLTRLELIVGEPLGSRPVLYLKQANSTPEISPGATQQARHAGSN